eukprot:941812_1
METNMAGIKSECKRLRIQNQELQQENQRLQAMDNSRYLSWNSQDVCRWIVSLNPEYKRYEQKLLTELTEEGICGKTLCYVKMTDIKDWGIKNIVSRQDPLKPAEGNIAATAYI